MFVWYVSNIDSALITFEGEGGGGVIFMSF